MTDTITTARHRQQPSRKGRYAAAGVTAAALLLGGGVLAAWETTEVVDPGTVTSGELRLESMQDGVWHTPIGELPELADIYPVSPGETLTYTETVQVSAVGKNLAGDVQVTQADIVGDAELAAALTQIHTVEINGQTVTDETPYTVTEADHGQVLDVEVTLQVSDTGGNEAQGQSAELGDIDITVAQTVN